MKAAKTVKPDIDKGITSQGFYVMNADGKAYGFNNNRSVERVTNFIQRGLDSFAADPPAAAKVEETDLASKWHAELPAGGISVRVHSRIRPLPEGCDPSNANVARDHLWIYPDEVRAMVKDAKMPESLVWRIARFHLVDNVRGEPDHWQAGEVKSATMTLTPIGDGKRFDFKGSFEMAAANGSRGLKATLEGRIRVDGGKLAEIRSYGEGMAWGRSTYTPNPPEGKFPIVFAFDLTDDRWSRHVTPQAVFHGSEYQRPRTGE